MVGYLNRIYGNETPRADVAERPVAADKGVVKELKVDLKAAKARIEQLEEELTIARDKIAGLERDNSILVTKAGITIMRDRVKVLEQLGSDDPAAPPSSTPQAVDVIAAKDDRKPWEIEGISRQAYYKRQRKK